MSRNTNKAGWNLDNSYANLPEIFYYKVTPKPVSSPKLVILNHVLADELGLDAQFLESKEGLDILAGNSLPHGAEPIAQAYAGHQFGHFTMLGDGRAVLLGEQITPDGVRLDIQLKGSGKTPYSRRGDGLAALGPMLREYIISEAMYALGVPTTRSLAVVLTGEPVYRETELPGAILTRVASSHIRVGTFQYAANWGSPEELKILADYTLKRHFADNNGENPYLFLLKEVIKRQASLIAKWQLIGFIHGVMNTDNVAISGETIDYGPCAFMDTYNPATVFSSIDIQGRYAYNQQPPIGLWNLTRFAESLLPLLNTDQDKGIKLAQDTLESYPDLFHASWLKGMREKLGLFAHEEGDKALVNELLGLMEKYKMDFTNTFVDLTQVKPESFMQQPYNNPDFSEWISKWERRLSQQEQSLELSKELMRNSNPVVIPRNQRVEDALESAVNEGSLDSLHGLLEVLRKPYDYSKNLDPYYTEPDTSQCGYRTFCGT
ncbi:MAG: protein adenylyltransferase SelO [Anaerovoracaceae bacterium]|jgi:uncharacterized protein YdiU (UPF0061 family)